MVGSTTLKSTELNKDDLSKIVSYDSMMKSLTMVKMRQYLLIYICREYITTSCPTWCLSLLKIHVSQSFCFLLCGFIIFSFVLLGVSCNSHLFCLSHNWISCNKKRFFDMLSKMQWEKFYVLTTSKMPDFSLLWTKYMGLNRPEETFIFLS